MRNEVRKKMLWGWGPHSLDLWGLRWRSSMFFLWGMRWGPQPDLRGVRCLYLSIHPLASPRLVFWPFEENSLGGSGYLNICITECLNKILISYHHFRPRVIKAFNQIFVISVYFCRLLTLLPIICNTQPFQNS